MLISDIRPNQSGNEPTAADMDVEQLLNTGAFTKEMMMGSTLRDLGSTIKDARQTTQELVDGVEDSGMVDEDEEEEEGDDAIEGGSSAIVYEHQEQELIIH